MERKLGPSVLLVIHGLGVGGAEKFLVSLANHLWSHNYNVCIISLSKENPLKGELISDIELLELERSKKVDLKVIAKLRHEVKLRKPETIICLGFFTFFYLVVSTIFMNEKSKKFISYHTTVPRSLKEFCLMRFYRLFVSKAHQIITVSINQEIYTARTFWINRNLFKTIHNGVDSQYWTLRPVNDSDIKTELNIPLNAKIILMTAAFRVEKNHLGALDALDILVKEYGANAILLFVGSGDLFPIIEAKAADMGLMKHLRFIGRQKDVRPYYWAADLFTLTSKSVETFSIAALEAMSCGIPVVLTNIGGASEMVIDGINGYLTETTPSAIADKWHKALCTNFNNKTIRHIIQDKFEEKDMIQSYINLLRS